MVEKERIEMEPNRDRVREKEMVEKERIEMESNRERERVREKEMVEKGSDGGNGQVPGIQGGCVRE